jgi:nucleotide-binding universal stress UspA family protein
MKKLLVPIDFSNNADKAAAAAKFIARKLDASLIFLHAYQPNIPDMVDPSGINVLPAIPYELEQTYKGRLEEFVDSVRSEGFDANSIWSIGGIHEAIFDAIEEQNPDLVIMGRTGTGGFIDKLIGSSATTIALDAKCPVLIIPPQAEFVAFTDVVYASQLEFEENDVLREVIPFVSQLGASFRILKVDAEHQPNIQPDHQFIDQIQEEFGLSDSDFIFRDARSVVSGIEDSSDALGADLIIVSSRKRGFLEKFIINPSITKKLIHHTHVPLLVYHLPELKIS